MIGDLILGGYLLGVAVAFVVVSVWLGRVFAAKTAMIGGPDPGYPHSTYYPTDRSDAMFGRCLVAVLAVGLWPLALPFLILFRRGIRAAENERELQTQLNAANAEIERIRRQEGWTT
jgi:hypothetical protein